MPPRRRPLLGHLMINEGLITKAQLDEALRARTEKQTYVPFEQLLLDRGIITPAQLNTVRDKYHKRFRLGSILVEIKVLTDEQLRQALQHQQRTGVPLGEALLKLNLVTERQLKQALCRQFDVAFVDLDAVAADAELTELVPLRFAQQHRVIPLARDGQRLRVAMDDPADVDVVEDLAASTKCQIEVVTGTSVAFQRAFLKAYGEGPAAPPAAHAAPATAPRDAAQAAPPLAELRAAHEAAVPEQEAEARVRQAAGARAAEAARALAELQAAHAVLAQERVATPPPPDQTARVAALEREIEARTRALQDMEQRQTRVLTALKGAQDALAQEREMATRTGQERDAAAQTRQEAEARQAETARALAELQAAHEALLRERETTIQTFRDLAGRTLAELEATKAALGEERARAARALQELEAARRKR